MKKIMIAVLALSILATGAFAGWYEGKVKEFRFYSGDDKKVLVLTRTSDSVDMSLEFDSSMTADKAKLLSAMIMTAQAGDKTVEAYLSSSGLTALKIK